MLKNVMQEQWLLKPEELKSEKVSETYERLIRQLDQMEQLGIYEVVPEDFALAEYVDTSKLELQKIVAEGLEYYWRRQQTFAVM